MWETYPVRHSNYLLMSWSCLRQLLILQFINKIKLTNKIKLIKKGTQIFFWIHQHGWGTRISIQKTIFRNIYTFINIYNPKMTHNCSRTRWLFEFGICSLKIIGSLEIFPYVHKGPSQSFPSLINQLRLVITACL